jgi:L-ascorbate metabolism protein UlaG (beta-lactamase superfamily)
MIEPSLRLLRHATLLLRHPAGTLLVDPMLSRAEAMDPVANAPVERRIPMVELPAGDAELARLLAGVDAVLVTHTHRDHWDARARDLLRRDLPIFCQPPDAATIREQGFTAVQPVDGQAGWRGGTILRTGGRHGEGEIGRRMGVASGYLLRLPGAPSLYIAGDTIWCAEVEDVLRRERPDVIVVNAGAARFLTGGPITMTADDVLAVCAAAPSARVVAVHLEAINHCLLTRAELHAALAAAGVASRVAIPDDGAELPW